jgi:hypothetical protein
MEWSNPITDSATRITIYFAASLILVNPFNTSSFFHNIPFSCAILYNTKQYKSTGVKHPPYPFPVNRRLQYIFTVLLSIFPDLLRLLPDPSNIPVPVGSHFVYVYVTSPDQPPCECHVKNITI